MILLVDLERRKIEEIEEKKFPGGKGLGFYLLDRFLKFEAEPLEEKVIIFSVGPLTGLRMSGLARCEAVFRSPLTGFIAESNCGGYFGAEIAKAGYEAIVVRGESEKPSLLVVDNEKVEIVNAEDLWGLDTFSTEDEIKKEFGRKFQVACIGVAGENLVRFASIEHAKGREFGRCGGGAVMGRMKLKAIAVKGDGDVEERVANYEKYSELKEEFEERIKRTCGGLTRFGTPRIIYLTNETGTLPSYYWKDGEFDIEELSPEYLEERFYKRKKACYSCRVACGKISKIDDEFVEGPEYETLFAFGSLCGNKKAEVVLKANLLCDKYGLDTISTGSVIAYLMNLKKAEFGDEKFILETIEKIAKREGIGNLLAEGIRRISDKFGVEGAEVKGLDLPGYEPRGLLGMALGYAVCYRGGCHIKSVIYRPNLSGYVDRFSYENQAELLVKLEDFYAFADCLVLCRFVSLPQVGPILEEEVKELYNAVTGEKLEIKDIYKIGAEVINLARQINVKLGLKREDDKLPNFFFEKPLQRGNSAGKTIDREKFEKMLEEYYRLRGWSS